MSKLRILIVEDEGVVAKDIKSSLRRLGYIVPAMVLSGEQAIKEVEKIRPDLVLMDIRLDGGMDGIQTAEVIRDRFHIPVVYLTAYTDKATLERAKMRFINTAWKGNCRRAKNASEAYSKMQLLVCIEPLRTARYLWQIQRLYVCLVITPLRNFQSVVLRRKDMNHPTLVQPSRNSSKARVR
jgi:CheY-like chemotaxis protein